MNQNKPSPLPQGEGPQPAGSAPAVSPRAKFVTAAALCVHAIAWTHGDETFARVTVSSAAVAILAGFFVFRALRGYFPPVVLAIAGGIALCAAPINFLIALLLTSPVGLLSILGSFVLFGAGTIFA